MRIFKGIAILIIGIAAMFMVDPMIESLTDLITSMFPDMPTIPSMFVSFVPIIPFIIIAVGIFYTLRGNKDNSGGE
jgi:hypothetical protein